MAEIRVHFYQYTTDSNSKSTFDSLQVMKLVFTRKTHDEQHLGWNSAFELQHFTLMLNRVLQ